MKRDDILKMAREAGFDEWVIADHLDECERFAAIVAAAERELCAKVCEEGGRDESGRIHVQAWGCAKEIRARSEA